ncbi:MAG: mannose-1-phosphate guanylyltransferase/mannose-6-phosphate isomerase [Coxiella sp. (in: Bacteria)]|nr:MAG: mannose-1-phosphate guanylyltransferase/mannose-6-phosphate isomerase [Coxiella sp. (in: g-proteobacteria)]
MKIIPVILCGGIGTRLWPVSKTSAPKQFVSILDEHTFFEATLLRLKDADFFTHPLIICSKNHQYLCEEQLDGLGISPLDIIVEPMGRNTMPAITIACLHIEKLYGAAKQLLILPVDHVVSNPQYYFETIKRVSGLAKQHLITFGVQPMHAHTGYGYLKKGDVIADDVYQVKQFIEKPSHEIAKGLVASDDVLWNSGTFLLDTSLLLSETKKHMPGMIDAAAAALTDAKRQQTFLNLSACFFERCENISIDYALLEKTDTLALVALHLRFIDIGSWESLYDHGEKKVDDNVCKGPVFSEDTQRCFLYSDNKLLVTIGLQDCIVVATQDSILVSKRGQSQKLKKILPKLSVEHKEQLNNQTIMRRPWGSYEVLFSSLTYKVKKLTVRSGAKLSLQMHEHRSEHWVVVSGQAHIICNEEQCILNPEDSFFIPKQVKHCITNRGRDPLVIIETQMGSYVGEDDIVRFDDIYERIDELEDIIQ